MYSTVEFIYSFSLSRHFFLMKVAVDPYPFLGTLCNEVLQIWFHELLNLHWNSQWIPVPDLLFSHGPIGFLWASLLGIFYKCPLKHCLQLVRLCWIAFHVKHVHGLLFYMHYIIVARVVWIGLWTVLRLFLGSHGSHVISSACVMSYSVRVMDLCETAWN